MSRSGGKSFWYVIKALRIDRNLVASRDPWPDDRYIFIRTMPGNKKDVIMLHDGSSSMPYSVQQDDIFMHDWEVE